MFFVGSLKIHFSVSLYEITFIEIERYPYRIKTFMALPMRKSDSDCAEHSLVVMNARAKKMPKHLATLIIFVRRKGERIDAGL
jgi:hypothetical protein